MTPNDPAPPQTEASDEERALVEVLALYLKETTIYPDANVRVREKLAALLEASAQVRAKRDRAVVSVCSEGLRVGDSMIEADTPMLDWLRERLISTALGGMEFSEATTSEEIHDFAEHLRDVYPRRHKLTTFEEMWPLEFKGLTLIPLEFGARLGPRTEDVVDGELIDTTSSHDRAVAELLESSEEVLDQVQRIEMRLRDSGMQESEERMLSLLGHIVHALPADVVEDASQAVGFVEGILESFESTMNDIGEEVLQTGDLRLQSLMNQLTHSFFGSLLNSERGKQIRAQEARIALDAPDVTPRLREEDEKIAADLPSFLRELDELADPSGLALTADELEIPAERTGILLHQLVHSDSESVAAQAQARLEPRLVHLGREELSVLTSYLHAYLYEDDAPAGIARVFDLLKQCNRLDLFRKTGALTHESARFHFPKHFRLYVESLDPSHPEDRKEVAKLCAELGPRRLHEAIGRIKDDAGGSLSNRLLDRLLAHPHKTLIPFVQIAIETGNPDLKQKGIDFLRDLKLEAKEALPLWIFESQSQLPVDYLTAICRAEIDGHYPKELSDRAGRMIRHFIQTGSWDDPEAVSRRCYAISRLAAFPSVETKRFLTELLKGKGFLGLTKAPRPIRQAAQAALLAMP